MQNWAIQTLNSLALGGLLFLLAAGFSLIFGLMRIANLTHGALFMLGAYLGVSVMRQIPNLWLAALAAGVAVAVFGGVVEKLILRKLGGNVLGQVLVTLGVSFIIADACLLTWGGDPIPIQTPPSLQLPVRMFGFIFPAYRLAVVVIAVIVAVVLYLLMDRTRIGAMIRAGVDDPQMASASWTRRRPRSWRSAASASRTSQSAATCAGVRAPVHSGRMWAAACWPTSSMQRERRFRER